MLFLFPAPAPVPNTRQQGVVWDCLRQLRGFSDRVNSMDLESAFPFPGELVDTERNERKKRIAGVDQDELLDPKHLADPDRCFCEFQGVEIHHKLYEPESRSSDNSLYGQHEAQTPSLELGLPMILLHDFGASVFSWNKVMKRLASLTGSKVLAFDRPAFGLTSRHNTFETQSKSFFYIKNKFELNRSLENLNPTWVI
ncbi:hypothetical protein GOBAR_AA17847 [Gossypium barbadense]|uniref:AB hydrolase-1 domain-containing protein n=1 Tax=Gossypium barbadense TaxID=3634 RepID=A0A2P5XHM1_GOSBA|nr:hypothetical protein GOBAR_AA17847 [Gossypium barbadense]